MLSVICADLTVAEPLGPLGQADADHHALADLGGRERRPQRRGQLVRVALLGERSRRRGRPGCGRGRPCGGSLSSNTLKPSSVPSKPSSSAYAGSPSMTVSCVGASVRRSGSKRVPNGSVTEAWVGRRKRPAVPAALARMVTPRRRLSTPMLARRPPSCHVVAQAARVAARDPALGAGQQHAGPVGRARRAREREIEVGREVVAHAGLVEEPQQRRHVVEQVGGQAVRLHARPAHRRAGGERVEDAVVVLVDGLGAGPGDRRHDDEHPRPLARLHEHRHVRAVGAGHELEHVHPRVAARRGEADRLAWALTRPWRTGRPVPIRRRLQRYGLAARVDVDRRPCGPP